MVFTLYMIRSREAEEGEPEDVEDEQEPEGEDLLDSEVRQIRFDSIRTTRLGGGCLLNLKTAYTRALKLLFFLTLKSITYFAEIFF